MKTILLIIGGGVVLVLGLLAVFIFLASRWLGVHPILAKHQKNKCAVLLRDHGLQPVSREALTDEVFEGLSRKGQQQDFIYVLRGLGNPEAVGKIDGTIPQGTRFKLVEGYRVSSVSSTSYYYLLEPTGQKRDVPIYWRAPYGRGPIHAPIRFTEQEFANFFGLGDFEEISCD